MDYPHSNNKWRSYWFEDMWESTRFLSLFEVLVELFMEITYKLDSVEQLVVSSNSTFRYLI